MTSKKRKSRRKPAEIRSLMKFERVEDALPFVTELVANKGKAPLGVVVGEIGLDGEVVFSVFGEAPAACVALLALRLAAHAEQA